MPSALHNWIKPDGGSPIILDLVTHFAIMHLFHPEKVHLSYESNDIFLADLHLMMCCTVEGSSQGYPPTMAERDV